MAEMDRPRYLGTFFSAKGEKDRFVLPADFRKALKVSSGGKKTAYLSRDTSFPCLVGYGSSYLDALEAAIDKEERLANERGEIFDRELAEMKSGGMVFETNFDASGRFIFPALAKRLANIGDQAIFIGSVSKFMIWDPETLLGLDTDIPLLLDAKLSVEYFREQWEAKS